MTDVPVLEPTDVDTPCLFCRAPVMVSYREESVRVYCTERAGTYGDPVVESAPSRIPDTETLDDDNEGYGSIGEFAHPPAGSQGRTPE